MAIEDELIGYLEKTIKEKETKQRNIEIIAYFYGFRDSLWPTLEETAEKFQDLTRERVRQIIHDEFRVSVDITSLPSIEIINEIITGRPYWTQLEIEHKLFDSGLAKGIFSIRGLLNLIEDLGINDAYDIYTPELREVTWSTINKFDQVFIIAKNDVKIVEKILRKAEKLPGRCGIADLFSLREEIEGFAKWVHLLQELIKNSKDAWTKDTGTEFWYLFENRNNTLINYSEKIFSVFDTCEVSKLAVAYRNALDRRTHNYPYPPVEIIADYLRSSIYFVNIHDVLSFTGEPEPISEIEEDIVQHLKENGAANYQSVFTYLNSKNYKKPHIDKALLYSPLVYVDKSKGFGNHVYSLVGNLIGKLPIEPASHDRYKVYLSKLRDIANNGTDETSEHKRRREQGILQDWLFEGKTKETCAICGNKYSVHALVAAHKKKRSKCNTAERLDPNIVMPLCLFGCDYLYEKRLVYIKDGLVREGNLSEHEDEEKKVVENLIDKKIDERWLEGPASYFENP